MQVKDKQITFEDVRQQTTEEYFDGNQFSIDAFNKKYAAYEGETYVQALKRVCDFIASVENTEEKRKYWSERWFDEIYNDWWHPAGSIMQGAGSGRGISCANCTTISLGLLDDENEWDNLESIIKNTAYTVAKCAAYRQGLGTDFSKIRPRGMKVENSANESTGAIHWMKFIDSIGYYVGQKGRIPAMLFSISCSHPDVEEFIEIKGEKHEIQNANISVQCTDAFYKAVENDEDWFLTFEIPEIKIGDRIYIDENSITSECIKDGEAYYKIAKRSRQKEVMTKVVKARKLLELIAKNMWAHAEPGIQNIDIARKYSNSDVFYKKHLDYDPRIIGTNSCSEQYLSRESLCVLASLNLGKFSAKFEEYAEQLRVFSESINRFLDNVNECELVYNTTATEMQRKAIKYLRRTGAGYTNISAWLFKQNLEYGSRESNEAIEKFTSMYAYWLYIFSSSLGKEKGNFELFSQEEWEDALFVRRIRELAKDLHDSSPKDFPLLDTSHARNVTTISIAPTGTLTLMFRELALSYGIDSPFFMYYWKRSRISGYYEYYFCVPRIIRDVFSSVGLDIPMDSDMIKDTWDGKRGKVIAEFIDKHRDKFSFKESTDIHPMDKLDLMKRVLKWVDSSAATTYILPSDSTWKDTYDFILEANKAEIKSITAFPDRKMYGIVSKISFKELAESLIKDNINIHPQNFSDKELEELNLSRENIEKGSAAPKRLEALDADIHVITVKGEKFIIAVGLQNGQPYEVFGGEANGIKLKSSFTKGSITKIKRGQYSLEIGGLIIEDFARQFTPTEQILFRMASLALRSGVEIQFVVEQLQKATDDLTSIASAASRVLKKYIREGNKVSGSSCPNCQKDTLEYIDGCQTCSICSWSKCN